MYPRKIVRAELDHADATAVVVRFSVHDTGIGIAESVQARLFQPFMQVDGSVTRKYGGTIGLASVLNIEQPAPTSTRRLPAATEQAPPASAQQQQAGQRLLLVEDHPVNQLLALRQLERLGWTAYVAANGREAIDAIARADQPYALVLMDCQMPEMDGFAATRAIRAIERDGRPRTPIVAMTANAMRGDREECLAAGMDDYLSKPVRNAELSLVLARWLPAS